MAGRQLVQPRQSQRQQDRRAWNCTARAIRPAPRSAGRRTSRGARGWASSSANCSGVVSRMSGGAWRWRWRRDGGRIAGAGFDRHRQAPSPRPALPDCAPHPPPAPSAARCRACAARAPARRLAAARPRSIRLGRNPARVLPPPVGATSSTLSPARRMFEPAPTDGRAAASRGRRTNPGIRGGSMARTLYHAARAAKGERILALAPPSGRFSSASGVP